ncbi:hypothetical protein [Dethiothermospora halolimnae]|uniref:hypothetical protein n=1 Tax=Dethiothermospora halolimnae TaxID=3114390 RepID=UPI003CCBC5DC
MLQWLFMIIPLYITYYTLIYAKMIWLKEKNKTASIVIIILAISITVLPVWLKLQ